MIALLESDLYQDDGRAEYPFARRFVAPASAFIVEFGITRMRKHDTHPDWIAWRKAIVEEEIETGTESHPEDIVRNEDGKAPIVVICRITNKMGEVIASSANADEMWLEEVLP
jgi:hypothetical protein